MTDILVRMNMPNSCVECSSTGLSVAVSILGASCPWCRELIDPKVNLRIARHADCPLVELPEHGELIDRDALPEGRLEWEDIDDAPVIVPSNKEETK